MSTTRETLDHHLKYFGEGNLDGDHAYILGTQKQPTTSTRWELTRVVRNGKILAQSFAWTITPKA
jgi:hypothetical protein